ncbi:fatty acid desaturase [Paraconexibacter antarcticus]|uniref:Fatty acid desaturase n=1 Tax=Paraconexibacter antarcticus TaxID=2949664 RepID=A0ABY5DWC7_9ACTN|nr:fatty acid desaturase [Paraconexibacter antarcticus]UTI65377.1 fatty acid desaturase [Paraconexibacter antarcticus]
MPAATTYTSADPQHPLHRLTPEQIDEIGEAFQAIHDEVRADLGERDAEYIRSIIQFHRRLAALSRIVLMASRYPPAWVLGTTGLSVAKILENMEIGHNVLHGQWDWMNDPNIHSSTWDWDTASTSASWKHSHNYLHHTYTNVVGKDKDVGYEIMRVDPKQEWEPRFLAQPLINVLLMLLFEWGVAFHDMDIEAIRKGEKPISALKEDLKGVAQKGGRQILKDYIAFPLLSGRKGFKATLAANATANLVRNIWSNAIIFCGHFPDQAYTFTEEEAADESQGAWYIRQLIGAANIEGSDTFHLMSGNLSYQVEHHLFPDMPSSRYKEIAPKVKAICEKYELPYNTGPFLQQWLMVQRTILRLAFPGGSPRPKAPPYVAPPETHRQVPVVHSVQGPIPAFP